MRRLALAAWLGYAALTAAVAAGWVDGIDRWLSALGGGSDEWRTRRPNLVALLDAVSPPVLGAALAVLLLAVAAVRRDVRRAGVAAGVAVAATAVLLATKELLGRPGVYRTAAEGAYPSGHTLTAVLLTGLALLLLTGRPHARHLAAAAAAGLAMGALLVLANLHWASDSLGAVLLGLAALATGTAAGRRTGDVTRSGDANLVRSAGSGERDSSCAARD